MAHFLEEFGEKAQIDVNEIIVLNSEASLGVVLSGFVDIYAARLDQGRAAGRRDFLFRVNAGQAFWGLGSDRSGDTFGIIAVASPGTAVTRIALSRVAELAADAQFQDTMGALVEEWVTVLAGAAARDVPPKTFVSVSPGETHTLAKDAALRPLVKVVWLKQPLGRYLWLGRAGLSLAAGDPGGDLFFPLAESSWLVTAEECTTQFHSTGEVVAGGSFLQSLAVFHSVAVRCLEENATNNARAGLNRLKEKTQKEQLLMQQSLAGLAGVTTPGAKSGMPSNLSGDPLFDACRLLGPYLGVTFVRPTGAAAQAGGREPLEEIARYSRVRSRKVILKDDWWKMDNGPLLGFLEKDSEPVALIRDKSGKYIMEKTGSSGRVVVNAKIAQELKAFAYCFYRPFPNKALGVMDLLKTGLFWDWKRDAGRVLATAFAGGVLGLFVPVATGVLFNYIIPSAQKSQLLQMTIILIAVAVSSFLFQISRSMALTRMETKMDANLQSAVWDRLLSLPIPFFRDYTAGELAMRANGINVIRQTLSGVTLTTIFASFLSLFNIILLFVYDSSLGSLAIILVAIALGVSLLMSLWQVKYQRSIYNVQKKLSGLVLQIISGINKFKVPGAEGRAFNMWASEYAEQKRLSYKARLIDGYMETFNSFYPVFALMIIFGAYMGTISSSLSPGSFLAFITAFNSLLLAMTALTSAVVASLNIIPLYEGAKPILQTLPEVDQTMEDPGELSGDVEVSHVSFRYGEDSPLILNDVSFHVRPGEFVALVGPSGSGKSTLLRLLLGFEKAQAGTVYYDGRDLSTVDIGSVRSQIGVVIQNGQLMAGNIHKNIVGATNLTVEDAWEAARMAGMEDDIRQMPMGMHTVVAEGAKTISGGQKQRLLIARAIVKKPRIIFFDEATSALDNKTQAIVSRSMDQLQATRVVIAHRLSTIINADRILVLDQGRVVQTGTYQELIDQGGLFARLAKRQIA